MNKELRKMFKQLKGTIEKSKKDLQRHIITKRNMVGTAHSYLNLVNVE